MKNTCYSHRPIPSLTDIVSGS
uniref:Uncharacterized protein n=1 Tax=Anguilla anguilla TaxID=7936 RepID=A0A0E9RQD3_ANGAN